MSILDAHGNPIEVEPIPDAPSRDSYDERMVSVPMAVHTLGGGGHIEDDDEPCGCDESMALRAEMEVVKAERDYLLQFCDASEVMQMRKHLAADWVERQGHLAVGEQSDIEGVIE